VKNSGAALKVRSGLVFTELVQKRDAVEYQKPASFSQRPAGVGTNATRPPFSPFAGESLICGRSRPDRKSSGIGSVL